MDSRSDTQLMVAVRNGEVSLLGELFDRHHRRLFNYFLRLTGRRDSSEDLVQEAFLRMLKYRSSYRADAPFHVWMFRIARNTCTDHWNRSNPHDPLDDAGEIAARGPSPFEAARLGEEAEALQAALLSLPPDRRELLALIRFEGLRHEEVATLLGCTAGAVKVRAHRALAELRDAYAALTGGDNDLRRAESAPD